MTTRGTYCKPLSNLRKNFFAACLLRRLCTRMSSTLSGFVGHGDTAFEQQFLHITVAQGEPIVEPDPMADNFAGKTVVLVTFGVGQRGHAGAPILGFI